MNACSHQDKILQGDVLEVLKTIPDESIDCCITSPPYWGLRDYGTAKWEGGNPECDPIASLNKHGGQRADRNQEGYKKLYSEDCAKCGAKRIDNQIGLEKTPEEYVAKMVEVFREVRRVLKKEGTCWLNLGDSYCGTGSKGDFKDPKYADGRNGQTIALNNKMEGLKHKDLVGIPWRTALALQADGWYLRQDIIWAKPNPMPESVTDRCTKSHEYVFLLTKSQKYFYDNEAIKEPLASKPHAPGNKILAGGKSDGGYLDDRVWGEDGNRNKRSVWTVCTKPFREAHFATFPEALIEPMVKAGCPKGGLVLDIFMGAGTTAVVAKKLGRHYLGIELNPKYVEIAQKRINSVPTRLDMIDIEVNHG